MKHVIISILFILVSSVSGFSETITLTLKNRGLMVNDLAYELGYQDIVSEVPNPQTKADYVIDTITTHLSVEGNDYEFVHPVNEIVITFNNAKTNTILDGFVNHHGYKSGSKKNYMMNVLKKFIRDSYRSWKVKSLEATRKTTINDADDYTSDIDVE